MSKQTNGLGNPFLLATAANAAGQAIGPTAKKIMAIGGAVIVFATAGGIYLYLTKEDRKTARKAEALRKANIPGDPAYYGLRFKLGFENKSSFLSLGTDEFLVFRTLYQIPSQSFMDLVRQAFTDITGNPSLDDALKKELGSDHNRALEMLSKLPKNGNADLDLIDLAKSADRIYEASNGAGTDDEEILAELRAISTAEKLTKLSGLYENDYGETLHEVLDGEFGWWTYRTVRNIIENKPDSNGRELEEIV